MEQCLENLPGVRTIVDDIVVFGKDRTEHDKNLDGLMIRCREMGIKLNPDKTEIGKCELPFFGHLITAQGLKIDPAKVKAIEKMPPPKSKSELQTILGMVTYLQRFAPKLSEVTAPLRQLLSRDVEFCWDKPQAEALQEVKNIITQRPGPVLSYFDPNKEVTLQVDASKYGLGATLLQEGKPVCFASKSLTPAEVNYAQISKELYAILFGCKKFHQYVYGKRIKCQNDHKPLQAIWKKGLHSAPPRLQRMLLHLQQYDIDLVFVPGKEIPLADTLSRKFLPDTCPDIVDACSLDTHVHAVISSLPVSDRKMEQIRAATKSDPQMQMLSNVILEGWSNNRSDCPEVLLEFWNFRDELSVIDDIILKGDKILVPKELRPLMLTKIHDAHLGVDKCTQRAREVLFWPNMTVDIKSKVLECPICIEHRCSNAKEPLQPSKVPDRPWQVCATDLFHWNNADFVLLVDAYSKYFEVSQLSNTKSSTVIHKLKGYFSRHGIPDTLHSDNGPCYNAESFSLFAKQYDFEHITSSPGHSSGNGLAEITVKTIKSLFTKSKQAGQDPYLAVLEYRNAPLSCGKSPAQLLMSRQLRSTLPLTSQQLDPKVPTTQVIKNNMQIARQKSKYYFDRSAKVLKPLYIGESVRIREGKRWLPAVVRQKVNDRSYIVETKEGAFYRRNRRHLLKSNEPPFLKPDTSFQLTPPQPPLEIKVFDPAVHNPMNIQPGKQTVTSGQNANSQESMIPSQPQTPKQTSPVKHQSSLSENPDVYTTRSGRSVKKPQKLTY